MGDNANVSGNNSFAIGYNSNAGLGSVSIGVQQFLRKRVLALGYHSKATGEGSSSVGDSCNSSAKGSFAMGYYCSATGEGSFAVGDTCYANKKGSVSIGYHCNSSGESSVSIGDQASTTGSGSIAIGYIAKSENIASIAIGDQANCLSDYSISIGNKTISGGSYGPGIAIGNKAIATDLILLH